MGYIRDATRRWLGIGEKSLAAPNDGWRDLAEFLGIDADMDEDYRNEATYYTCLKIISEGLGKMPVRLMRRDGRGGSITCYDKQIYDVLALRPNPYQTATVFWSDMERMRLHFGNAYAWIRGSGTAHDPMSLWVMPHNEVDVWWDETCLLADVPDVYYRWSHGGTMMVLKSSEVIHLRSSETVDGIMGIPVIERLGGVVEGSIKSQKFQNELVASGMTSKAVLQYTADLNPEMVEKFTSRIDDYAKGRIGGRSDGKIIPIPVGTQLTPLNLKLTDAQFMELKKYSAVQIASAFGIKPQQIGDMTKQSYASSQAQQEAFYTDTMLYIIRQYEDELTYKLLSPRMRNAGHFIQADSSVVLRSDFKTQVEANKTAIESGQMYPNEGRARLGLPSDPDGDVLLGNGNLIPIGMAGQQYVRDAGGGDESGNEQASD